MHSLDMYEQQGILGEGNFGQVSKCLNKETRESVALKKMKIRKNTDKVIQRELQMLKAISSLNPDTYNIVRFNKYFKSRAGENFMEFEMLDKSMQDLMKEQDTFYLKEIRFMAQQLLVALDGLRSIGVMHTDIKPDNIMLVDHEKTPFKVKLIDFGNAIFKKNVKGEMKIQPKAYRAPEVILGLPLSEAVDMWSLGCCLMEWYLCDCPSDVRSSYDRVRQVSNLLAVPDGELITRGKHGTDFFVQDQWRLKTPREYENTQGVILKMGESLFENDNLKNGLLTYYEIKYWIEYEDREAFSDLIQKMFIWNPEKRITPVEALQHPFITMSFMQPIHDYIVNSKKIMNYELSYDCVPSHKGKSKMYTSNEGNSGECDSSSEGVS